MEEEFKHERASLIVRPTFNFEGDNDSRID